MLDTIRRVLRHPLFDRGHTDDEYKIPWADFRTRRQYANGGTAYVQEFSAVYDFAKHGGAATTTFDLDTVSSGPPLGATIPIGATIFQGEIIFLEATVGAGSISVGLSAGGAGVAALLAATAATAIGTVLPIIPTYAGAGEITMSAEGKITVTTSVGTITAGKVLIRGKYAMPS